MNAHAKRRQVTIAVAMLSEVLAEVLQEAQDNGQGGLTAEEVGLRARFQGDRGQASRYILALLQDQGLAVDENPGRGPASWQLTGPADSPEEAEAP